MVLHSDIPPHQPLEKSFQHSRSYCLRARRKRSFTYQPSEDSFEQATRLLRLFHAHEAHSLDSILEHPEDDTDCEYDAPVFFPLSQRLTKAKTVPCLSNLTAEERSSQFEMGMNGEDRESSSHSSTIEVRQTMSIPEYSENRDEEDNNDDDDDDWGF
ncbi:unnamed protein product [Cylindrotheca closterium]|uniref:Uncharacterized protein n=1 Tax=Cylindrotheca closterium TaxID=2856 RepID=A0AAD2FM94_9STRA|nr:unnamed protein product [Cylindrotheca closterium]